MLHNNSLLKYLLDENLITDINTVADGNVTALHLATKYSCLPSLSLLLSKNASPTILTSWGHSAVHIAANVGHTRVMQEFMDYGCDLTLSANDGMDCEMIALKYGHQQLAQMIRVYTQKKGRLSLSFFF